MTPAAWVEELRLLPDYLGHHLALTLAALASGIVVCVPLGCWASRAPRLRAPVLALAGVLETVPSIALLALMVPLLGRIGFLPAFVALFLYSLLPILRNTVTGILGVDPAVTEAARAMGMSSGQMLLEIELPLAMPVIVAGIRTAAVLVVGTATLGTPVGATSLGNYIFSGLATQNNVAVIVGCLAAAGLAIVLDQLIRLVEISVETRRPALKAVSVGALALITALALWPVYSASAAGSSRAPLVVGAKPFTEQYVLADLLERRLRQAGFDVITRTGLGSRVLFDALANGSVDVGVDYSGTIWADVLHRSDLPDRRELNAQIARALEKRYGVTVLGSLGFEDTYALAVRADEARRLHLRSIADLAPVAPRLSLGADYEFLSRPEWAALARAYGLAFKSQRTLDPTLMYAAIRQGTVDVIAGYSTDGRLLDERLTILTDSAHALPPYDAVLLLSRRAAGRVDVRSALTPELGRVSDQLMRAANRLVDVGRRPVAEAAALLDAGPAQPPVPATATAEARGTRARL